MNNPSYEYLVIGAGFMGLAAAYYLAQTGGSVVIIDKFTIGNQYGSAHGSPKLIRSTYNTQLYQDLSSLALREYWPNMEQKLGIQAIHKCDSLTYEDSPNSYLTLYKQSKEIIGEHCLLTSSQVCGAFPGMPFVKCPHRAVVDKSGGIISVEETVHKLGNYLKKCPNVTVLENTRVGSVAEANEKVLVTIQPSQEKIYAKKVVVACGRWLPDLIPDALKYTKLTKQYTSYIELEDQQKYSFGKFPCFTHYTADSIYFFLPELGGHGCKLDLYSRLGQLTLEESEQKIRVKGVQLFGKAFKRIRSIEECYYRTTPTEDLLIDWENPQTEKVLIVSCCSGHGIKFSSVIGKIISDLLTGNSTLEVFQKKRHLFSIPFHRGVNLE